MHPKQEYLLKSEEPRVRKPWPKKKVPKLKATTIPFMQSAILGLVKSGGPKGRTLQELQVVTGLPHQALRNQLDALASQLQEGERDGQRIFLEKKP